MLSWLKQVFHSRAMPLVLTLAVMIGASSSYALDPGSLDSLIDFDGLAKHILPLIETAVTAAAGVGAVVLAAMGCWSFFRRFISG